MSSSALDALLQSMQHQVEAHLWTAFRESIVCVNSKPKLTSYEKKDMAQWASRINRREIFSRAYNPSVGELEEVRLLFEEISDGKVPGQQLEGYMDEEQSARSIILKRSPVLVEPNGDLYGRGRVGSMTNLAEMVDEHECPERELVLLTNHFVVVKLEWDDANESIVSKRMESYVPLSDVVAVLNLNLCSATSRRLDPTYNKVIDDEGKSFFDTNEFTFRILTASNKSFTFVCSSVTQRVAWLNAFQHAVIGAYMRSKAIQINDQKVGWQHLIIRKDMFSAAVCGDEHMLLKCLSHSNYINVNKRDSHGLTALHYAVHYGNEECVDQLLRANADPNVTDMLGRTALHHVKYCEDRHVKERIENALQNSGARKCLHDSDDSDDDDGKTASNWFVFWFFWTIHFFNFSRSTR